MIDQIIRATAADNTVSILFCSLKNACQEAISLQDLSGAGAEALSKTLIGGALLSATLKNQDEVIQIVIKGNGPAKGITVIAGADGNIKGYLHNRKAKAESVPQIIGEGILNVIKDIGMREPYIGQLPLVSGQIAEDITAYFSESEQIVSSCGINIDFEDDKTLKSAGGFLIQLLPGASNTVIHKLERDLAAHPLPTELIEKYGETPERLIRMLIPEFEVKILDVKDISWNCGCSREVMERALLTLGKDQLEEIILEDKPTEITCDFCRKRYHFSSDDLKKLISEV